MVPLSYEGIDKIEDLVMSGLTLNEIVDNYGRALHPDAVTFFSYHKMAKRLMLKTMIQYFQEHGTIPDFVERCKQQNTT